MTPGNPGNILTMNGVPEILKAIISRPILDTKQGVQESVNKILLHSIIPSTGEIVDRLQGNYSLPIKLEGSTTLLPVRSYPHYLLGLQWIKENLGYKPTEKERQLIESLKYLPMNFDVGEAERVLFGKFSIMGEELISKGVSDGEYVDALMDYFLKNLEAFISVFEKVFSTYPVSRLEFVQSNINEYRNTSDAFTFFDNMLNAIEYCSAQVREEYEHYIQSLEASISALAMSDSPESGNIKDRLIAELQFLKFSEQDKREKSDLIRGLGT